MIQTLFRSLRPELSRPGLKLQDQTDAQNWDNMFGFSESNGMGEIICVHVFPLQFATLVRVTSNLRTLNEGCDVMI